MSAKPSEFQGVFFDFDGTLADSIPVMFEAYRAFMCRYAVGSSRAEFDRLNGPALEEIVRILANTHKLHGRLDRMAARYEAEIVWFYERRTLPMPGAEQLLHALRQKSLRLALVSAGQIRVVSGFLGRHDWEQYFDTVVYGEDVTVAKPDPAIYRLALERTGLPADSVAVVEDVPNGVRAGKNAGLFVIGFAGERSRDELREAGADVVVDRLDQVLDHLGPAA